MSGEGSKISNPFSTGGGGHHFENQVQTVFVILMLSGGVVPCLPPFPIKTIKLQGRYEGYHTDDFIVFLEERGGGQKPKLLAQIRHAISITENDGDFRDVIRAAWLDFTNPDLFDLRCDVLALITGPLSANDAENARTILEWARHSAGAQEFLDKVNLGNFSSEAKRNKLEAFRSQLRKANNDTDVNDEQLWQFLRSYHLLGYDLDVTSGVTLSLLKSHIAQFKNDNVAEIWATVSKEVESFNQNAGTITIETLSEELKTAFAQRLHQETIPLEFLRPEQKVPPAAPTYPLTVEYENALVFASLLGGWNDKVQGDVNAIEELIKSND